jgi:hypothetical protein
VTASPSGSHSCVPRRTGHVSYCLKNVILCLHADAPQL